MIRLPAMAGQFMRMDSTKSGSASVNSAIILRLITVVQSTLIQPTSLLIIHYFKITAADWPSPHGAMAVQSARTIQTRISGGTFFRRIHRRGLAAGLRSGLK